MSDRILRLKEVLQLTGLSNSTIWRREHTGDFPKRIKISVRATGWSEKKVLEWINGKLSV